MESLDSGGDDSELPPNLFSYYLDVRQRPSQIQHYEELVKTIFKMEEMRQPKPKTFDCFVNAINETISLNVNTMDLDATKKARNIPGDRVTPLGNRKVPNGGNIHWPSGLSRSR